MRFGTVRINSCVASATDAAVQTEIFGLGMRVLIISNKEIDDTKKIVKSISKSVLLIKDVSGTIENEAKEQKGGFLYMILGKLGYFMIKLSLIVLDNLFFLKIYFIKTTIKKLQT